MTRASRIYSSLALGFLLSATAGTADAGKGGELILKTGDAAPAFSMRDLKGNNFALGDHVGPGATAPTKAVFIVFFATWCAPCKKEIPIIKRIHERWSGKGVEIVYIGLSQGKKELEPFAKKVAMPWPIIPDTFGLLSRRYGASELPHVILIDKNAKVAFQHRGVRADLQETIEAQLSKTTGVPIPS